MYSASDDLASVVTVNQTLQICELRCYSDTVGHHHHCLVFADRKDLTVRAAEHNPLVLGSFSAIREMKEAFGETSTRLHEEVEAAL
jgi:hypothetical protein